MAHILLIDDDERIRLLVRKTLENDGHTVSVARNGAEALDLFDQTVELVVTDVLMPRMGGFETIAHLRKRSPTVPIISMSAGGEIFPQQYLGVARTIGANCGIRKPFFDWELREAIDQLLNPREAT
jgi:CheY-like chemotaxis protein